MNIWVKGMTSKGIAFNSVQLDLHKLYENIGILCRIFPYLPVILIECDLQTPLIPGKTEARDKQTYPPQLAQGSYQGLIKKQGVEARVGEVMFDWLI